MMHVTRQARLSAAELVLLDGRCSHDAQAIVDAAKTQIRIERERGLLEAHAAFIADAIAYAPDGTWHRPLTPLELARLQDLPAFVDGEPLRLAGTSISDIVERIGNAVPAGAAQAIAEEKLRCLLSSDIGAGLVPSGGKVWVTPWAAHEAEAFGGLQ